MNCAKWSLLNALFGPQCGVLPGGRCLVHGHGVWAVHSADVHVGERNGFHHGGGAVPLRRTSLGYRTGVCSAKEKGWVSRTGFHKAGLFLYALRGKCLHMIVSLLIPVSLSVTEGACRWTGWWRRCRPEGWRFSLRASHALCRSLTRARRDLWVCTLACTHNPIQFSPVRNSFIGMTLRYTVLQRDQETLFWSGNEHYAVTKGWKLTHRQVRN